MPPPPAGPSVRTVIVMGVSASGKSTFGRRLAERLSATFIDGDDLHPAENVEKMIGGHPLEDADRWPWLAAVREALSRETARDRPIVIACSALKTAYRDFLRDGMPDLEFAFLEVDEPTVLERIQRRPGHFMKASLVASQFATLENPVGEMGTVSLDGEKPVDDLVEDFLQAAG